MNIKQPIGNQASCLVRHHGAKVTSCTYHIYCTPIRNITHRPNPSNETQLYSQNTITNITTDVMNRNKITNTYWTIVLVELHSLIAMIIFTEIGSWGVNTRIIKQLGFLHLIILIIKQKDATSIRNSETI